MQQFHSVLVVDDDPLQLTILKSYFEGCGIKNIHCADDASQALEFFGNSPDEIDLVISDIQMPNMDGIEFLRHLKSMNYFGKFALISGISDNLLEHASKLAKMHNLNLVGKILKPITKTKLDQLFQDQKVNTKSNHAVSTMHISQREFSTALINGDIKPYFQPKYDIQGTDINIIGAEALARWNHPIHGSISPEVFVKFAEENGRIEDLTFSVFDKVLNYTSEFLNIEPELNIAFNLSPHMISNIALPDKLIAAIGYRNLKPENISFEVTESSILDLEPTTLEVLSRLRISGFEVAIDDFGTGSSNIQTLRDFPYSELKIDRAFIMNAISDKFSAETVRASITLARQMNMHIVAEGVEDIQTLKFVRSAGIEYAQGFLMCKPISANDFKKQLLNSMRWVGGKCNQSAA